MSDKPFDATPEFKHFQDVMRGILSVSKKRLYELVKASEDLSPRKGEPKAQGRKRGKPQRG